MVARKASKKLDGQPERMSFGAGLRDGIKVFDVGAPRVEGRIIKHGPEGSIVDFGNGQRAVSNAYLRPLPLDKQERERAISRALQLLHDSRVVRIQMWINEHPLPNDRAIWDYIKRRWPSLSRKEREAIFQETET